MYSEISISILILHGCLHNSEGIYLILFNESKRFNDNKSNNNNKTMIQNIKKKIFFITMLQLNSLMRNSGQVFHYSALEVTLIMPNAQLK